MKLVSILFSLVSIGHMTQAFSFQERSVSRKAFIRDAGAAVIGASLIPMPAMAAPEILNTENGVKYAVLKKPTQKGFPQKGDIVAIEYTGYLSSGQIFDATHAEGKKNALTFELGSLAVIPGINEMVANMSLGEKVQAIVPPALAYGDKGVCLDGGECLIKPGSTLVYDIYLKRVAIPPP